MAFIDSRRARIGIILFLMASQGAAQRSVDLNAVLTRIEGQVTLSSESRTEFRFVRRATQRQVVRGGEVIHVPAGAHATLLCSSQMLVSLAGPGEWVLDAPFCERGLRLPENSYRNLASYAGRILPKNGNLLLEFETRTVEMGLGPTLLSPRNTTVMAPYPRLVWTQVPGAIEYKIKIRGAIETSIQLTADDFHCGPGQGPWHDLKVCFWEPSGKWSALEPEKPVFLNFDSASLYQVREVYPTSIHLLSVSDQRCVEESLRQIATLPIDKASRLLLTAGAYAQKGLYADAIATYNEALQAQEMPEVRVTLGDLYLTIGLTALADREYRQVLAGNPDSAAHAAAELGLGQVTYFRKLFSDSRAHFERAQALYTTLGLSAEAEAARAAAAQAQAPAVVFQ